MNNNSSTEELRKKSLIFSIFKYKLPFQVSIVFTLLLPIISYYLMEGLTHNPLEIPIILQILGWLFIYLIIALLFFITGRMNVSLFLAILIVALVGFSNYYVLEFRSSPILPWDILSFGTALSVTENFSFEFTPQLVFLTVGFVLSLLVSLKIELRSRKALLRIPGFILSSCMIIGFILSMHNETITNFLDVYEMPFTQGYTYRQNGFIISFLVNTKYLKVDSPVGYSAAYATKIFEEQTGEEDIALEDESISEADENSEAAMTSGSADTDAPNIIVIMNEAFSDLSTLGDFETNEDYMPFIRSLYGSENTISGTLYVSVLGGNTANTEFEFLTGSTMAFLPTGSVPYQQFIRGQVPALPQILSAYGYSSVAMHPYLARGWNRETVYPLLGFDTSLFYYDFDQYRYLRDYMTDECTYEQIINEYNNKEEGTPLFAFDVTMQNHGGYSKEFDNFEPTISVTNMPDLTLTRTNSYLSLIKESDDAFRELVEYFSNVDEKTIILMFGDHQPNVESAFLSELYGKSISDLTLEELSLRYQTPFIIWANYDIEEDSDVQTSANYLSSLLMDTAGLEKTDYQTYLSELSETIPVITANFYYDADGNFYSTSDTSKWDDVLNEYAILQYNALFDTKNKLWHRYLIQ